MKLMKQKVTIDDVARAAGVSKQTVSRAINNKGEISPRTRERILTLVKKMQYRPSRMAQAMKSLRSHMVGLVVPDIINPFFPEVVRAVQDAAVAAGYSVLICNTDNAQEIDVLNELVTHGIDGLITFTHQASEASVVEFANRFGPLLIINREFGDSFDHPNISSLLVDNVDGAKLAVNHLVELGHQKIGMITPSIFADRETRREQGYLEAIREAGLIFDPELIINHEANLAGGYDATKVLLANRPDITAIFAYNDLVALGAIRACSDLNLSVPTDISVIGFDDIQLSSMVTPALSSIRVDKYQMGRLAFERVYSLIQDPSGLRDRIEMQATLVNRESTGKVREN